MAYSQGQVLRCNDLFMCYNGQDEHTISLNSFIIIRNNFDCTINRIFFSNILSQLFPKFVLSELKSIKTYLFCQTKHQLFVLNFIQTNRIRLKTKIVGQVFDLAHYCKMPPNCGIQQNQNLCSYSLNQISTISKSPSSSALNVKNTL